MARELELFEGQGCLSVNAQGRDGRRAVTRCGVGEKTEGDAMVRVEKSGDSSEETKGR